MNSNPEAIDNFLAWLLQGSDPLATPPSGDGSRQGSDPDLDGSVHPQLHQIDPIDLFDSEELAALAPDISDSNHFSFQETPSFKPGDIPAVQDRFYALLKDRLRAEIERNPPLFPWETEVYDYEAEQTDWVTAPVVPGNIWINQLKHLNLPVPMPEVVLSQLFDQCRDLVSSSLQEGAKLVRAVEDLFPGHAQAINQLAGMVMTAPVRSGSQTIQPTAGFPQHYEVATQPQQMALSLIAAREILHALTLEISPNQPQTERTWQTSEGALTLRVEAHSEPGHVRIQGQLPCSGSVQLCGEAVQASAQRSNPGYVSVEVFDLEPNQVYPLEVRLAQNEQPPLFFAVRSVVEDL